MSRDDLFAARTRLARARADLMELRLRRGRALSRGEQHRKAKALLLRTLAAAIRPPPIHDDAN
jgi:hypothetical protein